MEERKIIVYSINELTTEAKNKAIEYIRNKNLHIDDYWWEHIIENWAEKLEELGFDVSETKKDKKGREYKSYNIQFTGFWSQGDGACFYGTVDLIKWISNNSINNQKLKDFSNLINGENAVDYSMNIHKFTHHYSHSNTVQINSDFNYDEQNDKIKEFCIKYDIKEFAHFLLELEEEVEANAKSLMDDIYKDLEEEYDGCNTDEAVVNYANEVELVFTEEGKLFNF